MTDTSIYAASPNPEKFTVSIDSRSAGSGKTSQGIYPLIKRHLMLDTKALMVVPSIDLQKQYHSKYSEIKLINSESHDGSNTVDAILDALCDTNLICITQAALLMLPFDDIQHLVSEYHLIVDESINPHVSQSLSHTAKSWQLAASMDLSSILIAIEEVGEYVRLQHIDSDQIGESSLINSEIFKSLSNTNYDYLMLKTAYDAMHERTALYVEITGILNPKVLTSFQSVHVAASAFENTGMASWMVGNDIQCKLIEGGEFIPHSNGMTEIYCATTVDGPLNLTGTLRQAHPEILTKHRNVVFKNVEPGQKVLVQRNNDERGSGENETRLNHNPHGLNSFTDYTAISIESSIRPSKQYAKLMNFLYGVDYETVVEWQATYCFYQSVMRMGLRLKDFTGVCKIFMADGLSATILKKYFREDSVRMIPYESGIVVNKVGRKKIVKSIAEKRAENAARVTAHRARKKAAPAESQAA